jgi:cytochrome c oxidase assembly factor CtaG
MAEHERLIAVAAPLLIFGRPLLVVLWALPGDLRRSAGAWARYRVVRNCWRALTLPALAYLLHAAWHVPAVYDAALTSEALHVLQHASFLATGLLFWCALVHGREVRMGHGPSIVLRVDDCAAHRRPRRAAGRPDALDPRSARNRPPDSHARMSA